MAAICANPECSQPIPEGKRSNAIYCSWQCRDQAIYLRSRQIDDAQSPERTAHALAARDAERRQMTAETGIRVTDEGLLIDEVSVGLTLGNAMASALYGSRGELRKGQ